MATKQEERTLSGEQESLVAWAVPILPWKAEAEILCVQDRVPLEIIGIIPGFYVWKPLWINQNIQVIGRWCIKTYLVNLHPCLTSLFSWVFKGMQLVSSLCVRKRGGEVGNDVFKSLVFQVCPIAPTLSLYSWERWKVLPFMKLLPHLDQDSLWWNSFH